jgi:hypothetical protein
MTGPAERPSRKPPEIRTAVISLRQINTYRPRLAPTGSRRELAAAHAAARKQLIATQAAARRHGAACDPAQRAYAEIVQAFAHRWAHIRRMPIEERAAAAAALGAEQAAALSARTRHLAGEVRHQSRAEHIERRHLFRVQRMALSQRQREAWARAAATIQPRPLACTSALRPPRPVP